MQLSPSQLTSSRETNLPDVVGIGCRRCGSSTLHGALNQHPEIGKPPRGLHYFSQHFAYGESWYADQLSSHASGRIRLEFSVSYTYPEFCNDAAERISQLVPNAKLFAILRNPIDRAFSDYLRSLRHCEIDPRMSFEAAIEQHPEFLQRGCYRQILEPYYGRFSAESLHVFFLDDLQKEEDRFWASLWEWLGVDAGFRPAATAVRSGKRAVRWPGLNRSLFAAKGAVDRATSVMGLSSAWGSMKRFGNASYRSLIKWNTLSAQMRPATRRALTEFYLDDVRVVERLTGRSLSHWLTERSD